MSYVDATGPTRRYAPSVEELWAYTNREKTRKASWW